MLVRDMNNETFDKINSGNGLDDEFVIFVPVEMESNMRTGVGIDAGGSNDGSAEIAANVLGNDRGVTVVWLGVDVETFAMITINSRLDGFERRADGRMEPIKQSSTKGFTQKGIVKMLNTLPGRNTPNGDFGDEDMNVRVPLKAAAEGMKNADETGSKMLSFIEFTEHMKNDVTNRMKETVKQRAISAKKDAEFFRNSEDAMPMNRLDNLEGHRSGALDGIEITTGRTKTAFAAERDKFKRTTRRTPVHSAAESRVATVNHFVNAFHDNGASFEGVLNFFIMI